MSEPISLLVLDLSHHDGTCDLAKARADGIEGIIWKCTEGTGFYDSTYASYRQKAASAGLLWGAYHFANASDAKAQAEWFIKKAQLGASDLFCLDWEPYSSQLSPQAAKTFVEIAEGLLKRPNECLIYGSSSFLTDQIPKELDAFFAARRLWLAQYGPTPKVPPTWDSYWLWQYAADGTGPKPDTVAGIPGYPDCNSFPRSAQELRAEWASGQVGPTPQPPPPLADLVVRITIDVPPGVSVVIKQNDSSAQS